MHPTQPDSPNERPTAEALFATFRAGYNALGQLLAEHRPYLLKIAHEEMDPKLLVRNGASDVVQDALLNVHKNVEEVTHGFFNLRDGEDLTAWLRRVLLNAIHNARRDAGRGKRDLGKEQPLPAGVDPPGGEPSPSGVARERERDAILQEQLNALPEVDRLLMRLSCWHDWTDVALAELLYGSFATKLEGEAKRKEVGRRLAKLGLVLARNKSIQDVAGVGEDGSAG
jgi:RNA polymerase sigma-70 factor (ECF subfamily)